MRKGSYKREDYKWRLKNKSFWLAQGGTQILNYSNVVQNREKTLALSRKCRWMMEENKDI